MTNQIQFNNTASNPPLVLLMVSIPLFLGVINASGLGVVLPQIGADLAIDTAQISWLMTGFLLAYAVLIPFYGRLGDLYGVRPLFLLGVGLFSIGSLLSALAPNYTFLLIARIVQASGGAAVPGLGMTIAFRAYGSESRGTVMGILAATIGAGAAIGPLLSGALSESLGWESIFFTTAMAALIIPVAIKILPPDEGSARGKLDIPGGAALGLMVAGMLLIPSEGARSGWTSTLVVTGAIAAGIGFVALSARQLKASSPFIPREFLRSSRYIALVVMSFSIMMAYLAPIIALPILLFTLHELSPLEVGLVMVPGGIFSSGFAVVAGRLTDWKGARLPSRIGAPLMLLAVLGLSTYAGSSIWAMSAFVGVLGAGFGLVNTPLAATVSRIVRGQMLSSALGINSMLFFLGGSFGTAGFIAVVTSLGGDSGSRFNPLHSGSGAGFSDAFLFLAIPLFVAMLLTLALPQAPKLAAAEQGIQYELEASTTRNWVADCSVPWSPECEI